MCSCATTARTALFERLRESRWLKFTEETREPRHRARARLARHRRGQRHVRRRVRHHLKRLLWRPEATVLLTGFRPSARLAGCCRTAAAPSASRATTSRWWRASSRLTSIPATPIERPVSWAQARGPVRGAVFMTHGEPEGVEGLERRLKAAGVAGGRVRGELTRRTGLSSQGAAPRRGASPPEDRRRRKADWHNARSEFLGNCTKSSTLRPMTPPAKPSSPIWRSGCGADEPAGRSLCAQCS